MKTKKYISTNAFGSSMIMLGLYNELTHDLHEIMTITWTNTIPSFLIEGTCVTLLEIKEIQKLIEMFMLLTEKTYDQYIMILEQEGYSPINYSF